MILLQENLNHLHYIGLWPLVRWPFNYWKAKAYRLYTILIIILVFWFGITESVSLFTVIDSIENFSDNCFMLLSAIVASTKVILILSRRSEFIGIIKTLETHPHKPMDANEKRIQDEFNDRIRAIGEIAISIMTVSVFFQGIPYGDLPYKAWIPYDISKPIMYWVTFYLQLLVVCLICNIAIGFDTIVFGFFTLICAQFHTLKYRLEKAIDEFETKSLLSSEEITSGAMEICEHRITHCIKYHRAIFKISSRMNSLFTGIIFVQYSASLIVICISIFMISQISLLSSRFLFCSVYLICMLIQIFALCATANAATYECENLLTGIYNTKWYLLTNQTKRYLVLMMARTLRPVIFMSGHIIVLSLDSFGNLLRRSYSAYTMLQKNSK